METTTFVCVISSQEAHTFLVLDLVVSRSYSNAPAWFIYLHLIYWVFFWRQLVEFFSMKTIPWRIWLQRMLHLVLCCVGFSAIHCAAQARSGAEPQSPPRWSDGPVGKWDCLKMVPPKSHDLYMFVRIWIKLHIDSNKIQILGVPHFQRHPE